MSTIKATFLYTRTSNEPFYTFLVPHNFIHTNVTLYLTPRILIFRRSLKSFLTSLHLFRLYTSLIIHLCFPVTSRSINRRTSNYLRHFSPNGDSKFNESLLENTINQQSTHMFDQPN